MVECGAPAQAVLQRLRAALPLRGAPDRATSPEFVGLVLACFAAPVEARRPGRRRRPSSP